MSSTLKPGPAALLVAAALAAPATASHAVTYSVANGMLPADTSLALDWATELVEAASLINSSAENALQAAVPAIVTHGTDAGGYATATVQAPITVIEADAQGTVTSVQSSGGFSFKATTTAASAGGSATFRNLRVDVADKMVYGDVDLAPTYAGGVAQSYAQLPLFLVEGAAPQVTRTSFWITFDIGQLSPTTDFRNALQDGLGLRSIGTTQFAMLTSVGHLQAVPEPSTYAQVGFGVAAALMAARRRRGARR